MDAYTGLLISRLELEDAFLSLWEAETASAPFGDGLMRSAGLLAELQGIAGGPNVFDPKSMARFLRTVSLRSLPPKCLHHIALFWSRVHASTGQAEAGCLSTAAWSALAIERSYLVRLLDELGATEEQRVLAIEERVLGPVTSAAGLAASEASECSPRGFMAAKLLADAMRLPIDEPWRSRVTATAERALLRSIASALDPLESRLALLPEPAELNGLVKKLDKLWRYFGNHLQVERFVAEHMVDPLWPAYRALSSRDFLDLIAPLELAVDALVRRNERGEEVAFLSNAVDMLAFYAFVQNDDEFAVPIYRRILKLLPTHRNARRCLAEILALHVVSSLPDASSPLVELERALAEAESLAPDHEAVVRARTAMAVRRP